MALKVLYERTNDEHCSEPTLEYVKKAHTQAVAVPLAPFKPSPLTGIIVYDIFTLLHLL